MVARKKTKTVPKAKAAARTKSKAKTKSSAGTVGRRAKSPPQPAARAKPATKTKPKTATLPRSKSPAKSKPKTPATTPSKPVVSVPRPVTPAPSNLQTSAPSGFQVEGMNDKAPFTLKLHRGDGMTLIAMNWKNGQPPQDFVGFAIEYQEPGGSQYYPLKNRLGFLDAAGNVDPTALSTLKSPIQKFRWVHFPRNADLVGDFKYRITPMFMDAQDKLSPGEPQEVAIQLARETYPGIANVTFTRGFVSSQAFVDRYLKDGPINTLVAPVAAEGLDFTSTHPDSTAALAWMGFEARAVILETLDQAIADKAEVRVVAYDFNLPEVVDRLEKLGSSLKIIIDDSKGHGGAGTAETEAEGRLVASAGRANVLRQHMGSLQHNKTIAVNGPTVKKVVCGSISWRGFFVQANNALVLTGQTAVDLFFTAFDGYFTPTKNNDVAGLAASPPPIGTTSAFPASMRRWRFRRTARPMPSSVASRTTSRTTRHRRYSTRSRSSTRRQALCSMQSRLSPPTRISSSMAFPTSMSAVWMCRTRAEMLRLSLRQSSAQTCRNPLSPSRPAAPARACITNSP